MRGGHRILPRYSAAVLGRAARSPILVMQRVLSKMDGSPTLGDRTAMSALVQKQTYAVQKRMSALPPIATAKADIGNRHVCFTPESGHVRCNYGCPLWAKSGHSGHLFNNLFGAFE